MALLVPSFRPFHEILLLRIALLRSVQLVYSLLDRYGDKQQYRLLSTPLREDGVIREHSDGC